MADIRTAKIFAGQFPSAFISPFSDKPPVAFYSSLVIPRSSKANDCLACALKDITRDQLKEFLDQTSADKRTFIVDPPAVNENYEPVPEPPVVPENADLIYTAIDLELYFPKKPSLVVELYGERTFGPFDRDIYLVSHTEDPISADDNFLIDGLIYDEKSYAHTIFGGATTMLKKIPAGSTFSIDAKNVVAGYVWLQGSLRLYDKDPTNEN